MELNNKRLLNVKEAAAYLGMGKNRVYDYCREIGAMRKYGKRTFFDKAVIDEALNEGKGLEVVR